MFFQSSAPNKYICPHFNYIINITWEDVLFRHYWHDSNVVSAEVHYIII